MNKPQEVNQISANKLQQVMPQSQQSQNQQNDCQKDQQCQQPQYRQFKQQQKIIIPNFNCEEQSEEQKRNTRSFTNIRINEQNSNINSTCASTNMSYAALSERRYSISNDHEHFNQQIQQQRNYQEEIRKEIMCKVCFKISDQLYTSNCCQQYMCQECNKIVQQCPICKKKFTLTKNLAASRLVYLLKQCVCKHNDCRFIAQDIFKLQEHENNCEHKTLKCTECKKLLKDRDFLQHFIKEHEKMIKEKYSVYQEDF
ncbi:hypothetical protein ABPG72_000732 [Tetrahymena utriculariae]